MIDADGKKWCPRCQESKMAEGNFYRINQTDCDGFSGYCVPCTKSHVVRWQKANPEKKAASDRKQNQKPERKAKNNERTRNWQKANREEANRRQRSWGARNRDKQAAARMRAHAKNPDARRKAQAKYHATDRFKKIHADRERLRRAVVRETKFADGSVERAVDGKFTAKEWEAILKAFNGLCAYCDSEGPMTIEHLDPLSKGGKNIVGNIAPACHPCNSRKSDKTVEEFAPERAAEIRTKAMLN